jgi:hypothetical protein
MSKIAAMVLPFAVRVCNRTHVRSAGTVERMSEQIKCSKGRMKCGADQLGIVARRGHGGCGPSLAGSACVR